ncbi:Rieske 2Fe-2S domain-containing protein [Hymenobacter sp. DH14]|uniref:Rieske 2Fe-2S domain-containing protein n=1 Tax=Hymenobacter cyanobacteriorum TaxID=2926463 RepID=A0A9X1VFC9_9BACT|nr:Rieske 2Fe-2S domain-containing protein [Hymenobacter cyanobacteriorum]MCI1187127.1 Rieske 2Fe-2S domain-containing protein [Hymenobacter cyanobacteriorum]
MATSAEMNRKEFLQLFGFGATALFASACLGGCGSSTSSDPVVGATNVDFTVDLTASSSAPLNNAAVGYIYNSTRDVIVAKTAAGGYVALQAPCPHEGTSVYFSQGQSRFICPNHNAIFDVGGAVLSGPSPRALKQYAVAQTGTTLRITG